MDSVSGTDYNIEDETASETTSMVSRPGMSSEMPSQMDNTNVTYSDDESYRNRPNKSKTGPNKRAGLNTSTTVFTDYGPVDIDPSRAVTMIHDLTKPFMNRRPKSERECHAP